MPSNVTGTGPCRTKPSPRTPHTTTPLNPDSSISLPTKDGCSRRLRRRGRAGRVSVESGVTSVPPLFLAPSTGSPSPPPVESETLSTIPSVDLALPPSSTLPLIRAAARSCGFFHVTNHAVDAAAVRAFHEQPPAVRSAFYAPASVGSIAYSTIPVQPGKSKTTSAGPLLPWRDTLQVRFGPPPAPDLARLPPACRDALVTYQLLVTALGKKMAGLLSEALGVGAGRLERAMRVEGLLMACHYYPPCPEPARVAGSLEHTDPSVFTVLAQDGVGGLQARLRDGRWADVPPVAGALLVNVGDVLKVVSNDEYESVEHRVVIRSCQDARVSIALFFNPAKRQESDLFMRGLPGFHRDGVHELPKRAWPWHQLHRPVQDRT